MNRIPMSNFQAIDGALRDYDSELFNKESDRLEAEYLLDEAAAQESDYEGDGESL
jgi:hypothetical protein